MRHPLASPLALCLVLPATAQSPVLLGDLAPGPADSRPSTYILFGQLCQRTLFNADDGVTGNEPWITDGTPAGTFRLADLYPGPTGSTPREYAAIGTRAVFTASLPGFGEELAVTDGTPAGTGMLADIHPGLANSNPTQIARYRGELLFRADDGAGPRVWRTDGTPDGTYPHPVLPAHCSGAIVAGNVLYWFRHNGATHELWQWDGIAAPTIVTMFPQFGSQTPPYLAAKLHDRAVFVGPSSSGVVSLWSSDGTAAGTAPFVTGVIAPVAVAATHDLLFYSNFTYSSGTSSLWVSNGLPGLSPPVLQTTGTISGLVPVGDHLFFRLVVSQAPFPTTTFLGVSDGTAPGTQSLPVDAHGLVAVGANRAAFIASDAANGAEVWLTDGTVAGTAPDTDLNPGPASAFDSLHLLLYQGGRLLFWATDGVHGRELFALHTGAGASSIGGGCSDGAIPELRSDDPMLGAQIAITGRSQLVAAPGFVLLGPVAGTPLIAPGGCELHVDLAIAPILVPCVTNPAGTFALPPLPVPSSPALNGVGFAAQAALAAPAAPMSGLAISNGVRLTLGA